MLSRLASGVARTAAQRAARATLRTASAATGAHAAGSAAAAAAAGARSLSTSTSAAAHATVAPSSIFSAHDVFEPRHLGPSSAADQAAMLKVIGMKDLDTLIAKTVPQTIRTKSGHRSTQRGGVGMRRCGAGAHCAHCAVCAVLLQGSDEPSRRSVRV